MLKRPSQPCRQPRCTTGLLLLGGALLFSLSAAAAERPGAAADCIPTGRTLSRLIVSAGLVSLGSICRDRRCPSYTGERPTRFG